MRSAIAVVVLLPVLLGTCAQSAWADEVVLTNGDVLHGGVTRVGDGIVLDHAVLGEILLQQAQVLSYRLAEDGPTPPALALVRGAAQAEYVSCAAPPCAAPTPPAAPAAKAYKRPWDLALTLGISDESGNTEKFTFNTNLEAAYRWGGRNDLALRLRSGYETAQGMQTEGNYHGSLKYGRRISPRGSLWAAWIADRDDFAELLIRTGWFVGYRHDLIKREKTNLGIGLGPGYVVEERVNVPVLETAALFGLASFKHEFKHGDTFRADYWITTYLDDTDRSPMRLELRYAHPLRDHFDITVGFIWDYVPNPPDNAIKPWDTMFTFGLRWKP